MPSTKQQLDPAKTPTKRQCRMHSQLQLQQLQQESPQQLEYGNKNDSVSIDGYMYLPELYMHWLGWIMHTKYCGTVCQMNPQFFKPR